MHPDTGDLIDWCFYSQKEPEKSAHKRHGDKAELREAAGDLFRVPDLPKLPRYPCAEILVHS